MTPKNQAAAADDDWSLADLDKLPPDAQRRVLDGIGKLIASFEQLRQSLAQDYPGDPRLALVERQLQYATHHLRQRRSQVRG
jgi:hypothetical protein